MQANTPAPAPTPTPARENIPASPAVTDATSKAIEEYAELKTRKPTADKRLTGAEFSARGGDECPSCGSPSVYRGAAEVHADFPKGIVQPGECMTCGFKWRSLFRLAGYDHKVRK